MIKIPKIKFPNVLKSQIFWTLILGFFFFALTGFLVGILVSNFSGEEIRFYFNKLKTEIFGPQKIIEKEVKVIEKKIEYRPQTSQEERIIEIVKEVSPAVVSIIVSKDLPIIEEYWISPFEEFFGEPLPFEFKIPQYRQKGIQKKEIGGGSGFIVSEDGLVLTNKHVVLDKEADYTVLTLDGKKFPARVLARDPVQDLAILKIEMERLVNQQGEFFQKPFAVVKLGDSDHLQIGQTVIAIGNALGEFRNTVSVGVISGLGRSIVASGGGMVEVLEDVIQTDAAINKGNSGGPLLNLRGEVIGVNTATVLGAQNIGFAIPINLAKKAIGDTKKFGKIIYPFLGVKYRLISETLAKERNLPVNYGALVEEVVPNSAAAKAGIKAQDIILEIDQQKISLENSLAKIIQKYSPQDQITLKIQREKKEIFLQATLGERSE